MQETEKHQQLLFINLLIVTVWLRHARRITKTDSHDILIFFSLLQNLNAAILNVKHLREEMALF